jgi:hypothetical protein
MRRYDIHRRTMMRCVLVIHQGGSRTAPYTFRRVVRRRSGPCIGREAGRAGKPGSRESRKDGRPETCRCAIHRARRPGGPNVCCAFAQRGPFVGGRVRYRPAGRWLDTELKPYDDSGAGSLRSVVARGPVPRVRRRAAVPSTVMWSLRTISPVGRRRGSRRHDCFVAHWMARVGDRWRMNTQS